MTIRCARLRHHLLLVSLVAFACGPVSSQEEIQAGQGGNPHALERELTLEIMTLSAANAGSTHRHALVDSLKGIFAHHTALTTDDRRVIREFVDHIALQAQSIALSPCAANAFAYSLMSRILSPDTSDGGPALIDWVQPDSDPVGDEMRG